MRAPGNCRRVRSACVMPRAGRSRDLFHRCAVRPWRPPEVAHLALISSIFASSTGSSPSLMVAYMRTKASVAPSIRVRLEFPARNSETFPVKQHAELESASSPFPNAGTAIRRRSTCPRIQPICGRDQAMQPVRIGNADSFLAIFVHHDCALNPHVGQPALRCSDRHRFQKSLEVSPHDSNHLDGGPAWIRDNNQTDFSAT